MYQAGMEDGCRAFAQQSETELSKVRARVQDSLVQAMWTLRRIPDPEMAWLYGADRAKWPDARKDYHGESNPPAPKGAKLQPTKGKELDYATQALLKQMPTAAEIDAMQPALDMLQLLPDIGDKKLVSAVAWHFDGEAGNYIYWDAVRPWLKGRLVTAHQRTLKRHYDRALDWLAQLVINTK